MDQAARITVARGDGIGPEIMDATLRVLAAAGAKLEVEEIEIGESVYKRGHTAGIEPSAWESLRRTKVFLKAPITTPQGGGFKSLNVTVRKTLGLSTDDVPADVSRRIEMLSIASVSPRLGTEHREVAVKLAEAFPTVFYNLTNQILTLTGQGAAVGKPKRSGQTPR